MSSSVGEAVQVVEGRGFCASRGFHHLLCALLICILLCWAVSTFVAVMKCWEGICGLLFQGSGVLKELEKDDGRVNQYVDLADVFLLG